MNLRIKPIALQILMVTLLVGCSERFGCMPPIVEHCFVQKLALGMSKQTVLEMNGTPFHKKTCTDENGDSVEEWHYLEFGFSNFTSLKRGKKIVCYDSITNTTILIFKDGKLKSFREVEIIHPPTEDIDSLMREQCTPPAD